MPREKRDLNFYLDAKLAVLYNLIHSSHRPLGTWYLLTQHVYSTALPFTLLYLILDFLSLFLSFKMSFAFLVGVPCSLCNKHMSVLEIFFKASIVILSIKSRELLGRMFLRTVSFYAP